MYLKSGVNRKYLLVLVVYVMRLNVQVDTSTCVTYVERVNSCPETEDEWRMAAKRKNCPLKIPECNYTDQLKYQCLINAWRNTTNELCGDDTEIIGFSCAEYNEGGNVIQENFKNSCKNFNPGCPFKYNSSTGYLYPKCYELPHSDETMNGTLSLSQSGSTTITPVPIAPRGDERSTLFIALAVVLVFLLVLILIPCCIKVMKRFRRMQPNDIDRITTEEIQEPTEDIPMFENV